MMSFELENKCIKYNSELHMFFNIFYMAYKIALKRKNINYFLICNSNNFTYHLLPFPEQRC